MAENFSFGSWVRRHRRALDLTQAALAQQVSCSLSMLRKIEADERRPSVQLVQLLAEIFALDPDERALLLKVARAERGPEHLALATAPVDQPHPALLPSGTLTFLFTDIVGSTRLWEQHPEAMRVALDRHEALLGAAIAAHGGQIFKTVGDALHAVFATPTDALAAALHGQRALQAADWHAFVRATRPTTDDESPFTLAVRMALHTGLVLRRGDDYAGPTLSRAARLVAAGHGGQILLSAATAELLRDQLPPDVTLRDLGQHALRSLARPAPIFQLCAPDLLDSFPPLAAIGRFETNLPTPATTFIGREHEIAALTELLEQPAVRLITLTGPGGSGKTRLALQVSTVLFDTGWFPNGVWFVNLAPIRDSELVATTIAQALDVPETGGQPLRETLKNYLRAKRMLLLLDNCEQVVQAAPLIGELLAAAPGLRVLATSRMPLRLSGEHEVAVPPLDVPDLAQPATLEHLAQNEAVRLFVAHARAAKADFALTDANAPAVAEICRRLDGLPLAIELAAARVKLFTPQALLARLDRRFTLLTGGPRDAPTRQQTLRRTLDWSYDLLNAGEQRLFARLGVCVGGWTLEAAETVCNASGDLPCEVLDGLAALIDHSLVQQAEGPDGAPRFTMLETIREYARERLEQRGEMKKLRQQHAAYYLGLAEEAEPWFEGSERYVWVERVDAELENVRAALAHFHTTGQAETLSRLAGALRHFWECRCYYREGSGWLATGLETTATMSAAVRAKALLTAGRLAMAQGSYTGARIYLEEGWALCQPLDDPVVRAWTLSHLGWVLIRQGDIPQGQAFAEEALAIFRALDLGYGVREAATVVHYALTTQQMAPERVKALLEEKLAVARKLGDPDEVAGVLNDMGCAAQWREDWEGAIALYTDALALAPERLSQFTRQLLLANLGFCELRRGNVQRGAACFAEVLALCHEIGHHQGIAVAIGGMAGVAALQGRPERAACLLGAALAQYSRMGMLPDPVDKAEYDRYEAMACAALSEEAFAAAWAAGQAMTLDEAAAEALGGGEMASTAATLASAAKGPG